LGFSRNPASSSRNDISGECPARSDAGGITSCSRWLSEATPPEPNVVMVRTPDGVPSILGSPPHDGIPPGCGFIDDPLSGGVARASLNHRLQDWIPPGSPCQLVLSFQMTSLLKFDRYEIRIPQAGGFRATSRWSSGATPPEPNVVMVRTPDGVPAILGSPPHDGIPPGCGFIDDPLSGGVARASLNHRLQDWIPPGSLCQLVLSFQMTSLLKFDRYEIRIPQAGGFPAISRWLSGATPPEPNVVMVRTPDGVPSILGSPPHDGIPPGCGFIDDPLSGGVARASLNHRLQDWIPPGSLCQLVLSFQMTSLLKFDRYEIRIPQAGGFPAISRCLSEATPPEPNCQPW